MGDITSPRKMTQPFLLTASQSFPMLFSMKAELVPPSPSYLVPGADFLKFAVAFVQLDLSTLHQGYWLIVRENFEAYVGERSLIGASGNCIVARPTEHPLPQEFELRHFQALQRVIASLLQDEATETIPVGTFQDVGRIWYLHGLNQSTPGRRQLMITGATEPCFVTMFMWLLEQEPPGRIRTCPECGELFVRYKQQTYCSRKCGNRLTVRQWRARQAEPAKA
jgi:hypothetical protein